MKRHFPRSSGPAARVHRFAVSVIAVASLHVVTAGSVLAQSRQVTTSIESTAAGLQAPLVEGRPAAAQPERPGVRFIVRSLEVAAVSSEINARITRLQVREGDRFKAGDLLVAFDCERILAELDGARATLRSRTAAYRASQQLQRYKAAGALTVEQALYEMEKSEAEVRILEARRSSCEIRASFPGLVVEKVANQHEVAQPNQPLLRIVNDGKLELVLMIPSSWIARVTAGSKFSVLVDETGETHVARILQSTGLIEPISQSIRLIAELEAHAPNVLPGMSGTALLNLEEHRK